MINCKECKGDCCSYIAIEIDTPTTLEDFDEIRWFLAHENVRVYLDNEGDWLVEFRTPCKNIDPESYKCRIYDRRPKICSGHGIDECVRNGEGEVEQILFETMDDVEDHMKRKFGEDWLEQVKKLRESED